MSKIAMEIIGGCHRGGQSPRESYTMMMYHEKPMVIHHGCLSP